VIVMPINTNDLDLVFLDGVQLGPLFGYPTGAQKRDREETLMLVEQFHQRYPGGVPPALYTAVKNALTVPAPPALVTMGDIRLAIDNAELALMLPNTNPAPPPPANNVQAFVRLLETRRGAYVWNQGTTAVFNAWANGGAAIADNAQINCWEAVLFSAQQAGLVGLPALAAAYAPGIDREQAIYNLVILNNGVNVIPHPGAGANAVQLGDVIMLEDAGELLHHVVAVVQPDVLNYHNIVVMSLWNAIGGGGFTRTTLGDLLTPTTVIRYATL
jgi:hypothetical protein